MTLTQSRCRSRKDRKQRGFTLLELIITTGILIIVASSAFPVMRYTILRKKETELRLSLREIRNAIDHYKDAADRGQIQVEVESDGYPPDLETLVNGVPIGTFPRIRFLRRIPIDPMTGRRDWSLQSVQDDPDSTTWGGQNVFDVHSKSTGIAIDGSRYKDW